MTFKATDKLAKAAKNLDFGKYLQKKELFLVLQKTKENHDVIEQKKTFISSIVCSQEEMDLAQHTPGHDLSKKFAIQNIFTMAKDPNVIKKAGYPLDALMKVRKLEKTFCDNQTLYYNGLKEEIPEISSDFCDNLIKDGAQLSKGSYKTNYNSLDEAFALSIYKESLAKQNSLEESSLIRVSEKSLSLSLQENANLLENNEIVTNLKNNPKIDALTPEALEIEKEKNILTNEITLKIKAIIDVKNISQIDSVQKMENFEKKLLTGNDIEKYQNLTKILKNKKILFILLSSNENQGKWVETNLNNTFKNTNVEFKYFHPSQSNEYNLIQKYREASEFDNLLAQTTSHLNEKNIDKEIITLFLE